MVTAVMWANGGWPERWPTPTGRHRADPVESAKLVIMDEATSALDENERRIGENLREQLHDCTVLYITHRLTTVKRADQIVMMHQGAVVEQGSHDELMKRGAVTTRSTANRNPE